MMLVAALAAVAVVLGAAPTVVAVGVVASLHPLLFLGGVVVLTLVRLRPRLRRSAGPVAEADFLRAVAAELRSGASLRHGLAAAAVAQRELPLGRARRLALAGAPFEHIAPTVEAAMPYNGRMVGAVLGMVDRIGGGAAGLFAHLASITDEVATLARERTVATAQARFSAGVVVGAPLVFTAVLVVSGGSDLLAGPGLLLSGAGLLLQMIGLGVVGAMLWRSR